MELEKATKKEALKENKDGIKDYAYDTPGKQHSGDRNIN